MGLVDEDFSVWPPFLSGSGSKLGKAGGSGLTLRNRWDIETVSAVVNHFSLSVDSVSILFPECLNFYLCQQEISNHKPFGCTIRFKADGRKISLAFRGRTHRDALLRTLGAMMKAAGKELEVEWD
jgi:hypothetical protein